MFINFNSTAQGASHIEKGTPCQDASYSFSGKKNPVAIAIVADGHGGEKYFRSDVGAKTAVVVTKSVLWYKFYSPVFEKRIYIDEFDKNNGNFLEKNIPRLEQQIVKQWHGAIFKHHKENQLNEAEMSICKKYELDEKDENVIAAFYGATLIAAMVTPWFHFAVQIGDGLCVKIEQDGKAAIFVPGDERLEFGVTTSLCDNNAVNNFRHNFGTGGIAGIVAATDGVSDSFKTEKYFEFLCGLRGKFCETPKAAKAAKAELDKFLPILSERGSRDDCSIAGVWLRE